MAKKDKAADQPQAEVAEETASAPVMTSDQETAEAEGESAPSADTLEMVDESPAPEGEPEAAADPIPEGPAPTRAEMNRAFAEIEELRGQIRALKASVRFMV